MTIKQQVIKVISDHLGAIESEVKPNHSITDDLGADSLDGVELITTLENEFKVEVLDGVWESWTTVQDVIDYFEGVL
jgi:acyl carrier protein